MVVKRKVDRRERVQHDAYITWIANRKRGTVEIATGLGKTFIGIHALHSMDKEKNQQHIFLYETKERYKDIMDSIKEYDDIYQTNTMSDYNVSFHCYQEAYKWEKKIFGLVIADEIHDALTPEYIKFFIHNTCHALLGLSAKIDTEFSYTVDNILVRNSGLKMVVTKGDYLKSIGAPIVYRYSLGEARENNLNRKAIIHIIHTDLEDQEHSYEVKTKNKTFLTTEKKQYDYYERKLKELEKDEPNFRIRNIMNNIYRNKRAKLLFNSSSKVKITRQLLKRINRNIVFGDSVDALMKVTHNTVTSRHSEDTNKYIRRSFDVGMIDTIGSFLKLKQGANLVDLKNVVIMTFNSKEKDFIQRIGRLRHDGQPYGNVFILVHRKTIEEEWIKKILTKEIRKAYTVYNHDSLQQCLTHLDFLDEVLNK